MSFKISDLWRWDGTVGRGVYAGVGLLGFALKHNLDRLLATKVFGRPWGLFNYLSPGPDSVTQVSSQQGYFLLTLLAVALPFIWTGVCLTLRRLRATRLPLWLVLVFFVPLVNLIFFLVLAVLPSQPGQPEPSAPPNSRLLQRLIPDHPLGDALMANLLVVPCALVATVISVEWLRQYGWSLFVGLPFAMGLGSVLLYGYHRQRRLLPCLGVAVLSVSFLGAALFALALEGVLCLIMAAPLGLMLGALGGAVGYCIQRRPRASGEPGFTPVDASTLMVLPALLLGWPALMGAESLRADEPPLYSVTSFVEVEASPTQVWPHVIEFSRLPPPSELVFRAGCAYPIQARLEGKGVGAIRRCVFSTGPFIEPITVWDEPRHLAFSVTSNPDPLQEWTPYGRLHAPHTDGYLVSQGGEFRLIALGDGRTRLQGTTWYRHGLWPADYWSLWSDAIIHIIHLRVLRHIKAESENAVSETRAGADPPDRGRGEAG
jgi:hypothetical protein